jgi:hypothetical protein
VAVGDEEARADPAEASDLEWFEPDGLPEPIAFPHHAPAVLTAWREAVRAGRTVTPLPDAGKGHSTGSEPVQ